MMNLTPRKREPLPVVDILKNILSLIATGLGLVVIVIGLKYAMDIFGLVFAILKSPAYLTGVIHELAQSIGGSAFDLKLDGRAVPLANLMALAVYCCGAFLIAWLTLALMHTGAKIVSLTSGDRSAVKQVLQSIFGKSFQTKTTVQEDTQPRSPIRPPY